MKEAGTAQQVGVGSTWSSLVLGALAVVSSAPGDLVPVLLGTAGPTIAS